MAKRNRTRKPQRNDNSMRGKQGKKDSDDKRINLDNERISKFDRDERNEKSGKANDVSWYAKNTQLLESAASIGFSQTTGQPDGNGLFVPGVMQIGWVSSLGGFYTDPINQAKDSIYSYTVHANSRNTSYGAADEMMLILAGKEVFIGIANLIRVYGQMLKTNQQNKYLPKAIVTACGIDYDDAVKSYHKMLFDINLLIADSRQIWIPNFMPVITREFWLASNVYMDSESEKGQYYVMTPVGLRIYDETGSSNGGRLIPCTDWTPYSLMTWDNAVAAIRSMIKALINSEDRGLIFGDILKAYGEENIFRIAFLDSNYESIPVYDKEVLTQIENCSPIYLGTRVDSPNTYVTNFSQNPNNGLISEIQPVMDAGFGNQANRFYRDTCHINFHFKGQPSAADIMVATRLAAIGNAALAGPDLSNPTTIVGNYPNTCGTEYVLETRIFYYNSVGGELQTQRCSWFLITNGTVQGSNVDQIGRISTFDWAPWVYLGTQTDQTNTSIGTINVTGYIADVDNYLIVPRSVLRRMHNTAILSEFGVPVLE